MQLPETRQGLPVYSGGPAHLSEYLFKVGLKSKAIASIDGEEKASLRAEKYGQLISNIVDGLQGRLLTKMMDVDPTNFPAMYAERNRHHAECD